MAGSSSTDSKKMVEDAIVAARQAIANLLDTEPSLRPQCIRIAFYDALTYDPITKTDGPNGSIRIWEGLAQQDEMKKAIVKLDNLKFANSSNVLWACISHADLYQLAGIEAVGKAGGPLVEFQHGRKDSYIPLHSSKVPLIDEDTPASSIKATFYRLGFTDKEIVALSSAFYYWMNYSPSLHLDVYIGPSYYAKLLEISAIQPEASTSAIAISTTSERQPIRTSTAIFHYIKCLLSDASFRKHVELFAKDPNAFKREYSNAHKKLSNLGFKHFPEPILTEAEHRDIKNGIVFAVAISILFGFLGFFYEAIRT